MAIVETKSGPVTNEDAVPSVANAAGIAAGLIKQALGTMEAVSGNSIASVYLLCAIPSNAYISQILLSCDAITTCAGDVGIYSKSGTTYTVVDADFFGSAIDLSSALKDSNVTHESAVFGVEDIEKPLWEALGLAADPGQDYYLAVTLTAAAGSAGTISAKAHYAN